MTNANVEDLHIRLKRCIATPTSDPGISFTFYHFFTGKSGDIVYKAMIFSSNDETFDYFRGTLLVIIISYYLAKYDPFCPYL